MLKEFQKFERIRESLPEEYRKWLRGDFDTPGFQHFLPGLEERLEKGEVIEVRFPGQGIVRLWKGGDKYFCSVEAGVHVKKGEIPPGMALEIGEAYYLYAFNLEIPPEKTPWVLRNYLK